MLGWNINVYRQDGDRGAPATSASQSNLRIAAWQTGIQGTDWLDALVAEGNADLLAGGGFPTKYTAKACYIVPVLRLPKPPGARDSWVHGIGDTLSESWAGRTTVQADEVAACLPDEWLIIDAWDES